MIWRLNVFATRVKGWRKRRLGTPNTLRSIIKRKKKKTLLTRQPISPDTEAESGREQKTFFQML